MKDPTFNCDGYPTDETLATIKKWNVLSDTFPALMEFIHKAWWQPEWGWHEENALNPFDKRVRLYSISTGGWSGNEDLIGAMQDNHLFWSLCWKSSRRGGHYEFEVRRA